MTTTNRPDTTFYSTEGVRNTTIISIQDLKNRFTNNKLMTTTAPWQDENDETENYLKYALNYIITLENMGDYFKIPEKVDDNLQEII